MVKIYSIQCLKLNCLIFPKEISKYLLGVFFTFASHDQNCTQQKEEIGILLAIMGGH